MAAYLLPPRLPLYMEPGLEMFSNLQFCFFLSAFYYQALVFTSFPSFAKSFVDMKLLAEPIENTLLV